MKILMVNKFLHLNGGSETYIFKLGRYLASHNHEVQYFGMDHEERCEGNCVDAYTSNMDFHSGNILSKLKYPLQTVYSPETRKKIRLVLEQFKPDVVHLNNFNYQLTPSVIVEIAKWRIDTSHRCRIVFTAHDYNLICPNHMLRDPITGENCEKCLGGRFINCTRGKCIHGSLLKSIVGTVEGYFWQCNGVYRYIDCIICCSGFMKSKMDTNPLFKSRTVVLRNFIDRQKWQNVTKKKYVLYFGRLSEEKGINTLLEAVKLCPEVLFVFAGNGPLENKLKDLPNVRYVGFKKGNELASLIREASFSVCPSQWYENCPFSVMESQALGTPVIGTRIGGIPELIEDRVNGRLFERKNSREQALIIRELWHTPEVVEQYRNECRKLNRDDLDAYCGKLLKLYTGESLC